MLRISTLLDLVFPPPDCVSLLRAYPPERFVTHGTLGKVGEITYLAHYQTPAIQAAITANKFHYSGTAAELLATLIYNHLSNTHSLPHTGLVPIPISHTRFRERGYNQVEEIMRRLPIPLQQQTFPNLLSRTRHRPPQTSLNRTERLENVSGVFTARTHRLPTHINQLIIIDDVVTTGATLKDAARALTSTYPNYQITLLALAH